MKIIKKFKNDGLESVVITDRFVKKEVRLLKYLKDYLRLDENAELKDKDDLEDKIDDIIKYAYSINKQHALFYIVITNCIMFHNINTYMDYVRLFKLFNFAFRDALCSVELFPDLKYSDALKVMKEITNEEDLNKKLEELKRLYK